MNKGIRKFSLLSVVGLFVFLALAADDCSGTSELLTAAVKSGDSLSDSPGSCVARFPPSTFANLPPNGHGIPDGKKWVPLTVTTSHPNKYCPNRDEQIVELRGWIYPVAGEDPLGQAADCNHDTADPDWHIELEVDSAWAVKQGIDLNHLLRVGNLALVARDARGTSIDRLEAIPMIHMEIWGWLPAYHPGQSGPKGWKTVSDWSQGKDTSSYCPDVLWPFNPKAPIGQYLADGGYVRVVGSLVTDDSHALEPDWTASFPSVQGWPDETFQTELDKVTGGYTVAKYDSPDAPTRWTEMHPPDLIVDWSDPGRAETLRGIALFAHECIALTCETQTMDDDIAPPSACPATAPHVGYQELVGMDPGETTLSSIIAGNGAGLGGTSTGAQITVFADHIHVHVSVKGKDLQGGYGRFKALYRAYCTA